MNKPPKTCIKNGIEYYLVKEYSHIFLYENEYGLKESFKADELGLIEKVRVIDVKWSKMELGGDIKPENKFRW